MDAMEEEDASMLSLRQRIMLLRLIKAAQEYIIQGNSTDPRALEHYWGAWSKIAEAYNRLYPEGPVRTVQQLRHVFEITKQEAKRIESDYKRLGIGSVPKPPQISEDMVIASKIMKEELAMSDIFKIPDAQPVDKSGAPMVEACTVKEEPQCVDISDGSSPGCDFQTVFKGEKLTIKEEPLDEEIMEIYPMPVTTPGGKRKLPADGFAPSASSKEKKNSVGAMQGRTSRLADIQRMELLKIIESHKEVIQDRSQEPEDLEKKRKVWEMISKRFNEAFPGWPPRELSQLKRSFEYVKKKAKDEYYQGFKMARITGADPLLKSFTPEESTIVYSILREELEMIESAQEFGVPNVNISQNAPDVYLDMPSTPSLPQQSPQTSCPSISSIGISDPISVIDDSVIKPLPSSLAGTPANPEHPENSAPQGTLLQPDIFLDSYLISSPTVSVLQTPSPMDNSSNPSALPVWSTHSSVVPCTSQSPTLSYSPTPSPHQLPSPSAPKKLALKAGKRRVIEEYEPCRKQQEEAHAARMKTMKVQLQTVEEERTMKLKIYEEKLKQEELETKIRQAQLKNEESKASLVGNLEGVVEAVKNDIIHCFDNIDKILNEAHEAFVAMKNKYR